MTGNTDNGTEIIKLLGVSSYALWLYLKNRNFVRPDIYEIANHFQRTPKTIKVWIRQLEEHGYI